MAMINCKECGGEVSEQASQCPKCGCPLGSGKKILWLAVVLNLLIPGAGYLYNGRRMLFGILLLVGFFICLIGVIDDSTNVNSSTNAAEALGGLIILVAFAIDAYREAVAINAGSNKEI